MILKVKNISEIGGVVKMTLSEMLEKKLRLDSLSRRGRDSAKLIFVKYEGFLMYFFKGQDWQQSYRDLDVLR